MKHLMPQLPYGMDELVPFFSKETLEFHYGKHLQTYVDNLNKLIVGTEFEEMPLEEIIRKADGGIFNNAAQTWNHTFYFDTFTPKKKDMPTDLEKALTDTFDSIEKFKEDFKQASVTLFGSGWTWLVKDKEGQLKIVMTSNAGSPLSEGLKPILVIDVWEHAYYIDFRNSRPNYFEAYWNIIDWEKVAARL